MLYCLKCGATFDDDDTELCENCNVIPVPMPPEDVPDDAPEVMVANTGDEIETGMVLSLLHSIGIPTMLKSGPGGATKLYLGTNIFGDEIYVPARYAKIAKEFLDAPPADLNEIMG